MTEEQRKQLADKVTELLRKEWANEFTDEDAVRIYDFCMQEVGDLPYPFSKLDIMITAQEFELR